MAWVKIEPYSDAWPRDFARIAKLVRSTLGDRALRIDHIGSTSVPGLDAKDTIDVQVTVADLDDAQPLLRAGFQDKGLEPKAAAEREIAGYHAQGIIVDQSDDLRHVYYVVVYTEKVFAVRLSYDPASPDALAVYRGVLDSCDDQIGLDPTPDAREGTNANDAHDGALSAQPSSVKNGPTWLSSES